MRNESQWPIVNSQWHIRKTAKCIILLLAFYFLYLTSFAQSVSASLDRDKILLGEQVTLTFTLNNINEHGAYVSGWPQLADTLNHIEVLNKKPIDTIAVSDTYTYQQNFTLTSFDSGQWQIGPFIFTVQDKITGKQFQLTSSPLYLTVLSVDVSSMNDYHAMKDIIDVPASFNQTPVIIAAIIIALAVIAFIIIKKRKKKAVVETRKILKGTPLERAIEKLQALDKMELTSTETIKKFHSGIDDITRKYFEEMMQVKALQLTTSELFNRMHVYMQDAKLRLKFQEVFETNAAVKFAKYFPQPQESKSTLKQTINSLQQIDDIVNAARNNANRMVQKY